jgi:hypothetical protein
MKQAEVKYLSSGQMITVLIVILISSCNPRIIPSKTGITHQSRETLEAVTGNNLEFETFSAKIKVESDLIDRKNPLRGQIKIANDSIITISVNLNSGFPVAKLFFTTDSFYIIDRVNKAFIHGTYNHFNELYHYPVHYRLIQSVLLGEIVDYPPGSEISFKDAETKDSTEWSLFIRDDLSVVGRDYLYHYLITKRIKKVSKTNILFGKGILDVLYSEFLIENTSLFPHELNIKVKSDNKTEEFNITFSNLQFDKKLKFSVKVPRKYE